MSFTDQQGQVAIRPRADRQRNRCAGSRRDRGHLLQHQRPSQIVILNIPGGGLARTRRHPAYRRHRVLDPRRCAPGWPASSACSRAGTGKTLEAASAGCAPLPPGPYPAQAGPSLSSPHRGYPQQPRQPGHGSSRPRDTHRRRAAGVPAATAGVPAAAPAGVSAAAAAHRSSRATRRSSNPRHLTVQLTRVLAFPPPCGWSHVAPAIAAATILSGRKAWKRPRASAGARRTRRAVVSAAGFGRAALTWSAPRQRTASAGQHRLDLIQTIASDRIVRLLRRSRRGMPSRSAAEPRDSDCSGRANTRSAGAGPPP